MIQAQDDIGRHPDEHRLSRMLHADTPQKLWNVRARRGSNIPLFEVMCPEYKKRTRLTGDTLWIAVYNHVRTRNAKQGQEKDNARLNIHELGWYALFAFFGHGQ